MMVVVLLSILCSMVTGVTVVYALLPRRRASRRVLAKLTIGAAMGMFASGYLFLLSLMFTDGSVAATVTLDLTALLAALVIYAASRRLDTAHEVPMLDQPSRSILGRWLLLAVVAAAIIAVVAGTRYIQHAPYGYWDAWSTWNLKARFLYLGGEHWSDAFNPNLTGLWHDYPLLLPLTVARLWTYAGSDAVWVPQMLALGSLLMAGATMFGLLWAKRGLALASLGVLMWTGAWNLIHWSAAQYADIPLAWLMIAATSCLALAVTERERPWGWWMLAGLLASAAASTKNEGLLFCVVIALVASLLAFLRDGKAGWRHASILLVSMLPGVLVVLAIKARVSVDGQALLAGGSESVVGHAGDWSRHQVILRVAGQRIREAFDWWLLLPLLGIALATGLNRNAAQRLAALGCGLIALLMAGGYYVVLLNSRLPLDWHARTATERLALHLWPLLCMSIFLLLRSPEEFKRSQVIETDVVAPAKSEAAAEPE